MSNAVEPIHAAIEAFTEGGWVMIVIFSFGLVGVAAAGRFAWRGEHQLLGFIRWISLAVLASGAFGLNVAMLKVLRYVVEGAKPDKRLLILLAGFREALNNPAAALMFLVAILLLTAIGYRRHPSPGASLV